MGITNEKWFTEMVMEHLHDVPARCRYIPSRTAHPNYLDMTEGGIRYHVYWRSCLKEGRCLRADMGYVNLLVNELLILGTEPASILELLRPVYEAGWSDKWAVADLAADLCIMSSLGYPEWMRHHPWEMRGYFLSYCLASPVRYMLDVTDLICRISDYRPNDRGRFVLAFNHSLRALDGSLLKEKGRTLLDTYSEGRASADRELFRGFVLDVHTGVSLGYARLGSRFDQLAEDLCALIDEKLCLGGGIVPRTGIPEDIRTIVGVVSSQVDSLTEWADEADRPIKMQEYDGEEDDGRLVPLHLVTAHRVPETFWDDVDGFASYEHPYRCPYVPSFTMTPDIGSIDDAQRDFYAYWRGCVRLGTYPATDIGYIWLFFCEEISGKDDPMKVFRTLRGICRAYSHDGRDDDSLQMFRKACLDLALLNGLRLPPDMECGSERCIGSVIGQFLQEKKGVLGKVILCRSARMTEKQSSGIDDAVAAIASKVLLRTDKELDRGILQHCQVRTENITLSMFEGLNIRFMPFGHFKRTCSYPKVLCSTMWGNEVKVLLKAVRSAVDRRTDRRKRACKEVTCFGMEMTQIISEETEGYFRVEPEPVPIVIDRNKVDSAQEDLDFVSDAMRTKDEEDVPEHVEVKEIVPPAKGWDGFRSCLDGYQLAYLRLLVGGKDAVPLLKESGRTANSMVDSINAISLECIGDTVIEDGKLVEEYLEELRPFL